MIYTSYFSILKRLPDYVFPISIAGKTPEWANVYKYRELAPKYEWWREWKDNFKTDPESNQSQMWYITKYYETVLDKLDPKKVSDDLFSMSNGKSPCLLCYEKPSHFCHRHLVSEWLNDNGIESDELHDTCLYDRSR